MSKVEVNCDNCGKSFLRASREVKRSLKKGRKSFCSRTCVGKNNTGNFGENLNRSTEHLKGYTTADEFTGFRWHLRKANQRNHECDLTLEYLKELFEAQEGKCKYTKVKLNHPKYRCKNNHIYTASLDRIDSTKGYVKGNVQFISIAMNHMKSSMSESETYKLLDIIKNLK